MTCQLSRETERFEDYLLGRLSEAEQAEFELHFFECDECLAVLETMRTLQAELAASRVPAAVGTPWWRSGPMALAAGVGAIVLAGALFLWTAGQRPGQVPAAGAPLMADATHDAAPATQLPASEPASPPASAASTEPPAAQAAPTVPPRRRSLGQLAQFTPPPYFALTLRGGREAATADDAFATGMQRYMARDYAGARQALTRAVGTDPGRPAAQFYLGICQLLDGEAEEAAATFARTVALGDSMYYEDAHFFLAKARLSQGRIAEARTALEAVATMAGDREAEARTLLGELAGR